MAHNWHWVSSMGTNVKINIFGARHVTSANVNKKPIPNILLSMTISTNIIIYLFSNLKNVRGHSFLTKTRAIFITKHGFAFSYISRIHVSVAILYQNLKTHFHTFMFLQEFNIEMQQYFLDYHSIKKKLILYMIFKCFC